jgi:hypothetical protein
VDRLASGAHQELRAALPGIALVQVIHVRGAASLDAAKLADFFRVVATAAEAEPGKTTN